jgi:hypothetical protein
VIGISVIGISAIRISAIGVSRIGVSRIGESRIRESGTVKMLDSSWIVKVSGRFSAVCSASFGLPEFWNRIQNLSRIEAN